MKYVTIIIIDEANAEINKSRKDNIEIDSPTNLFFVINDVTNDEVQIGGIIAMKIK